MREFFPRSFWGHNLFDDQTGDFDNSGVTVYEKENAIVIEASFPGVAPDDVEITSNEGWLLMRGERKEITEDKQKKFYKKSSGFYSYRVPIPKEAETSTPPKATYKNGVMKIQFQKKKGKESTKIDFKVEE